MSIRAHATALAAAMVLLAAPVRAAEPVIGHTLDTLVVESRQIVFGSTSVLPGREDLNRSLARLGLHLVRRGPALAADLNADGFHRAEIAATVDGERYHCACPNRMDPPTTLALPVELAAVTWDRSSAAPAAGLAGEVRLERRAPAHDWNLRGGFEGGLATTSEGSGTVAFEGRAQRLALRGAAGRSYRDARDRSFGELYGYRVADVAWNQTDLSWHATPADWTLHAQVSRTRDVPYAYLQMDERTNLVWNGSIARAGAKLYANRSQHLMDNGLRRSTTGMSTAADQFTAGLTGTWRGIQGESFVRHWNANNTIATATSRVENRMVPRFRQWQAGIARGIAGRAVRVNAKLALTSAWIGDASRLNLYRAWHPHAEARAWFVPFAVGVQHDDAARRWSTSAELASDAPTAEQLFITVRRPATTGPRKPDWTGNPTLVAPRRASLRGEWHAALAHLEVGGSYVQDDVLPVARRAGTSATMTYASTDVALASGRADGRLRFVDWALSYTLGWNLDRDQELAEVPPFLATLTARPPLGKGLRALVRVEAAGAQRRVDETLYEAGTDAWGRLDLGVDWVSSAHARVALEVDNVTASLYSDHLSYVRDPFAAGVRVLEPGRTLRAVVTFGN
ncbi:MAG: hypothetical protein U0704_08735 [Candidatus Eisenbacteria bacterium]